MKVQLVFAFQLMIVFGMSTFAQDGHYSSENYGNRSMLLSGTVNASVEDLGAVFYNPGRLGLIENPAFAISAKVYEWRTLKVKDGINDGIDLNQSDFGGAPSLVAGTFKVPFLKNHKFAYSFLTRARTDADFFVRVEREGDIVDGLPGAEIFNGKLDFNTKFKEEWIGLTWAPPTSKKVSVGVSTFLSTLKKSSSIFLDMAALNEQNQVGFFTVNRSYNYELYSLLWKVGLAVDLSKIRLGLTVTTPRIGLHNDGSTIYENYLVGVDTTGNGINNDQYIFNIQDKLKTLYKSPWAVGIGVGIPFKKGVIHLSADWYDKVPAYTILEASPFTAQSTGETVRFNLVDDLDPVINYGIGIELDLSEKISAYGSFATDNSAVKKDISRFAELEEQANNSVFQADFYKFGGGVAIKTKAVEITVGATNSGASQEFNRPINFPDEDEDDVFESGNTSKLVFNEWRFILGFSFPFAEKLKEKLEGESEE
jgi:hypothetical protein